MDNLLKAHARFALPLVVLLFAGLLVVHAWLEGARTHAPHDEDLGAVGILLMAAVGLLTRDVLPLLVVLVGWAAALALYEVGWICWRRLPHHA